MEGDFIPQQALEKIEQIDAADLVVGILADLDQESVATVHEALRALHVDLRIVILLGDTSSVQAHADSASSGKGPQMTFVPWPPIGPDASGTPMQSISAAYLSLFAAGKRLGAQAGCIIASKLEAVNPQWVCHLMQPVLETGFDLAAPHYARRKFEGLLNVSIISPLIRCLYGKRLQNPLGPDLGFSRALFEMLGGSDGNAHRIHPLASLAPVAICDNLRVCQVHVGPRILPPTDWTNISSLLVQALGPVFLAMERNAACWQKTRESIPVSGFGEPQTASHETATVDVNRLLNSFQLGNRDLQEIWGLVLPPGVLATLLALVLSDAVLGFYPGFWYVYAAALIPVLFGRLIRNRSGAGVIAAAALASSLSFFMITNFMVWATDQLYPHTLGGLTKCYLAGIPFYRNQVLGDAVYTVAIFGGYAVLNRLCQPARQAA